jgi:hypothetical protein
LATPMFTVAAQALWTHTGGIPLALGALLLVHRGLRDQRGAPAFALAGALAGLAFAVRPTNAVFVVALGVGLVSVRAWRPLVQLTGAATVVVIAQLWLNLRWFGQLTGGYESDFGGAVLSGLLGLLLSPARGLLLYVPVVLFVVPAVATWRRRTDTADRAIASTVLMAVIGQLLLIASWRNWWGGHSWGPRLLIETVPLLLLLAAPAIEDALRHGTRRRLLVVAASAGCVAQLLGAFGYSNWNSEPLDVNAAPERLWDWGDSPFKRALTTPGAADPYRRLINFD